MTKHFLFAKLFLLTIFLANICENYAYRPPEATVQPLHPKGLRISIPGKIIKILITRLLEYSEQIK